MLFSLEYQTIDEFAQAHELLNPACQAGFLAFSVSGFLGKVTSSHSGDNQASKDSGEFQFKPQANSVSP